MNAEERINLANDPTKDTSQLHSFEVVGDTATSAEQVVSWLNEHHRSSNQSILALFSTYQSSQNTAQGLRELNLKAKLMVCDEAHRTAGIKRIPKSGERLRNFTLCHDKDLFPATYRIYQTATPRVYTNASNKQLLFDADDAGWDVKSMDDVSTFGPEFYRLSYVEAVKRNLLSDYRIIAWGLSEREAEEAERIAEQLNEAAETDEGNESRWDRSMAMRALTLAAFVAGCVPNVNIRSVIAFCNRIRISSELADAVVSKPIQDWLVKYFKRLGLPKPPAKLQVKHVDAKSPSLVRSDLVHRLGTATNQEPFCISNVGIFGEGTDSPGLSAVAFLNPRKSPVDVIQAVGRAMRKSPHKEFGYVLVPVVIPENHDPESFLRNSAPKHGWEELGQILQALRAHDGRIEDHLESLMEFYIPPPIYEQAEHLVVTKESYQPPRVFVIRTRTQTVEQIVAPAHESDSTTIEERLRKDRGSLKEIDDPSMLDSQTKPKSICAVVRDRTGSMYMENLTYSVGLNTDGESDDKLWDPDKTVETAKEFIRKDKQRRKKQMRTVPPRRPKKLDRQQELGLKLLHLEKDTLVESGVHLNLLEMSGIQGGARRDVNLLKGTVKVVTRFLHEAELESTLAIRLGLENVHRSSPGTADACTVAAIIWLNAAIMHARLERADIRQLRNVASLKSCISHVTPALGLMEAWRKVLIKDYVPIFEIAVELLQDVAFRDIESVNDALRHLVKSATYIADDYANLGMDHAGELFNSVMGHQRSDGAFFTRPIAAAMLAELTLSASGYTDWLDESQWEKLRTFDPACGSGTILVAMMSAIKRHIKIAGGDEKLVRRFHRHAVERLMVGADINHVALQLAACQLTLGEVDVAYDRINLHQMPYGPDNPDANVPTVSTGTVELLLDERLFPNSDELQLHSQDSRSSGLKLAQEGQSTDLADDLVDTPVSYVVMNPPYTPWTSIGGKFDRDIQISLRERLSNIWDLKQEEEPILATKKSSIATLFETIAMNLSLQSNGVVGTVRPSIIASAEDSRPTRKEFAALGHIDFVLTCHDPSNFNLSWDTNINECLIIISHNEANKHKPTRFINLHRFPETVEEAYELIGNAVSGEPFNGSTVLWDYDLMLAGDWTPAVFADCELAQLARQALDDQPLLSYEVVNSKKNRNDMKNRGGGGGGWKPTRFDI